MPLHTLFRRGRVFELGRMFSTVVGSSGREYTHPKVLQHHPTNPFLNLSLANGDNRLYVHKPVSQSIFDHLQEFKKEFGDNPRLRIHVDHNKENKIVVYEYFKTDLLSLLSNYPPLSVEASKSILKELGLGLKDMHSRNWIHLDVKPNNVFLNWYVDENERFHLQKVALGDMDCALKLKDEKLLNHRIGNVMWRSPEGQLGKGIGKPSEVFSFALVCLYVITGVEWLHPNFEELEVEPELVILFKLLSAFGPLPDAFIKHINDEEKEELLKGLWQSIVEDESNESFEQWSQEVFPNLDENVKKFILRMTNLDPAKRASMSDIMADSFWN